MIIVKVVPPIQAEYVDRFVELFNTLRETVLKEDGCIEYSIFRATDNKDGLFIFERWKSREALGAHLQTEHTKNFFKETEDWSYQETKIEVFEAEETPFP